MSNRQHKSPLHQMTCTTHTVRWSDSCSVAELPPAIGPEVIEEVMDQGVSINTTAGFAFPRPATPTTWA